MKLAILLAGYGNVARRFVQLLDESRAYLDAAGIEPVVAGFVTRHHGSEFSVNGLRKEIVAADSVSFIDQALSELGRGPFDERVLVETTTLDVSSGRPAIDHVRAGFRGGAHVITANKGPVAFAYRELADEAAAAGVSFYFEGAVMDGIPVFNLVRETMPGVTIRGFRGVVNTTTNYLIAALERGEPFEEALARMQSAGVAEADPSLDVDGWDAAAKTAALANVWLNARTTPRAIAREGLDATTGDRARAALSRGRRLKVVASARSGDPVPGRVELLELAADDPLAILEEHANAIEIDTWPLGRVVITQRDGGLEKTAYALFADLMKVAGR